MKDTKDNYVTVGGLLYSITAIGIVLITAIIKQSNISITIVSILGIMQSLLVAKEKQIAFIFGIIRMTTYGFILFGQKIYGGAAYSILYVMPMYIYGYINWGKARLKENSGVKKISLKMKKTMIPIFIIIILIYIVILKNIGSNQYILDGIISVLGFLGIYISAKKYIEQFRLWIISDVFNIILWTILTIQSSNNLPILLMWVILLINSTYADITWRKKYLQ